MRNGPSRDVRRSRATPSHQGNYQSGRAGKTGSQGVKDRWATSDLYGDPDNCETGGHHPRPHRLTANRTLTGLSSGRTRAGLAWAPGLPRRL